MRPMFIVLDVLWAPTQNITGAHIDWVARKTTRQPLYDLAKMIANQTDDAG